MRDGGGQRRLCIDNKARTESYHHRRCPHHLEQLIEQKRAARIGECSSTKDYPRHNHPRTKAAQHSYHLYRWRAKLKMREKKDLDPVIIAEQLHYDHPFVLDIGIEQMTYIVTAAAAGARGKDKVGNFNYAKYTATVDYEKRICNGEWGPIELGNKFRVF